MVKKEATIDDVLAQLLALRNDMNQRFDSVEQRLAHRLDIVEKRLTDIECRLSNFELQMEAIDYRIERLEFRMNDTSEWLKKIDQRFNYMEEVLYPSFRQLQLTVRDHGTRIRRLEGREGLLEEEVESVVE